MNYNIEPGPIAEVGIDREAAAHCLTLLSSREGAADVQLWPADAGVWNNVVIEAVTPQQTYYFKQYREFAGIPNYSPPRIPAEQRAQVAQNLGRPHSRFLPYPEVVVNHDLAYDLSHCAGNYRCWQRLHF